MKRSFALLFVCAIGASAEASPIDYLFSGNVSGSLDAINFVQKDFVITLSSDTTLIDSFNGFHQSTFPSPVSIFIQDIGTLNLDSSENAYAFYSDSLRTVGIGRATTSGDMFDIRSLGLSGWDMRTAIGPVSGTTLGVNQFVNVATNGGLLTFDPASVPTATFEARMVPEPATMAALGLGVAAMLRRRRSK